MHSSFCSVTRAFVLCVTVVFQVVWPALASAQGDDAHSGVVGLTVELAEPAPWRIEAQPSPERLRITFRGLTDGDFDLRSLRGQGVVTDLAFGAGAVGWSVLDLTLAAPMAVETAGMVTGLDNGAARITLTLAPMQTSAASSPAPPVAEDGVRGDGAQGDWAQGDWARGDCWARGDWARQPPDPDTRPSTDPGAPARERLVVMLDPGHGGIDPGAVRDGYHEADITLQFARVLRDALYRRGAGRIEVRMTRDADVFVSLEGRIAAARQAGADLFVSIHADAVVEGIARGAQIYTLSEGASSRAAAELAERHNRADLLAGIDLGNQDDRIASVLMDIARIETAPRAEAMADMLVESLRREGIGLHARPRETAAFAVLKAPDIPSVLVEIGFMSSPKELEKLLSEAWQARAAQAMAAGVLDWVRDDARRDSLVRR